MKGLDAYITGNWGEKAFDHERDSAIDFVADKLAESDLTTPELLLVMEIGIAAVKTQRPFISAMIKDSIAEDRMEQEMLRHEAEAQR